MALCLIVDDDRDHSEFVANALRAEGYETRWTGSGAAALEACHESLPSVVLLDLGLPDCDGLTLIPRLIDASPMSRVIVLTGRDSVGATVEAMRSGARHYLVKPWDLEELLLVIARESRAVDRVEIEQRGSASGLFWGADPAMGRLRRQIQQLAGAPETSVLLTGPTGSGKEMIARDLHRLTAPDGQFVAVNCAAVPAELMESELFGHEKGAFTGAATRRRGLVELARDGTLFLDEIAEMSAHLQAKLLRFLEGHAFRRVGSEEEMHSRCRVVAATHRDIDQWVAGGRFREDLFFRLAVVRLRLPSLRERRADVAPLAYYLLQALALSLGRPLKQLSAAAEAVLSRYDWPGNVRELRNRLERALVLGEDEQIQLEDLELPLAGAPRPLVMRGRSEADRLRLALDESGWNVARTARTLGVPRHWLRYHMLKWGLVRHGDE